MVYEEYIYLFYFKSIYVNNDYCYRNFHFESNIKSQYEFNNKDFLTTTSLTTNIFVKTLTKKFILGHFKLCEVRIKTLLQYSTNQTIQYANIFINYLSVILNTIWPNFLR